MQIWNSKQLEQMLEPNDWLRLQEQVRSRAMPLQPIPTETKSKLSLLDNVRGVLFDIYGTLLISRAGEILASNDSRPKIEQPQSVNLLDQQTLQSLPELLRSSLPPNFAPTQSLQTAIQERHKELKSPKLQYPEVDVITLWHSIFLRQLEKDMHGSLSPFILARFALEYELRHNHVQLMPGAQELLHWLVARNFYVGIISNAQFYTPIIMTGLLGVADLADLNISPELSFWSYRHDCSKPQPELFAAAQRALALHDLEPKEIVYLGNDMHNDIWGAAQVGFRTALFAGDERSLRLRRDVPAVASTEPDVIITELGQLKSVL